MLEDTRRRSYCGHVISFLETFWDSSDSSGETLGSRDCIMNKESQGVVCVAVYASVTAV